MNRRLFVGALGAGLGFVFVPRLPRWRADDVFVERWSWAMGQPVHVMVLAGSEQEGLDACAAALAELRRVERPLTLFDTASDLCELNRRAGGKGMRVDRDLRAVLEQAAAFKRATEGAFNVAVEPLMRVWGFHRHRSSAPTAAELAEAREAVLAAVVELDGDVARLPSAHTQLDFGAIGVGYGIDRAVELLRARWLRRCSWPGGHPVECGGRTGSKVFAGLREASGSGLQWLLAGRQSPLFLARSSRSSGPPRAGARCASRLRDAPARPGPACRLS